jgi:hypothetical protein
MGASNHTRIVPLAQGETAAQAFARVSDEEGYENGHSYSGDFGSKHGVVVIATTTLDAKALRDLDGALWDALFVDDDPESIATPVAPFDLATTRRIAALMDDKWGPAVAIVGNGHVLLTGMCPS